jgi:hypothetical protein
LKHVAGPDSPISTVANVSIVFAAWRQVHTGCNFFQSLCISSQLCSGWTLKVSSMMSGDDLCQNVHHLVL